MRSSAFTRPREKPKKDSRRCRASSRYVTSFGNHDTLSDSWVSPASGKRDSCKRSSMNRSVQHSLDPSLAMYTNMADNPDPQPIGLASNLVTGGSRAILVVDNCPSDLHQRLSELCRHPESKVSVITVEYDIKEDEPEGTEVFTLKPSSPELIEKLVSQRFPDLSQIDARTIAEFSGGNARIAIALAARIGHKETVAGLTDERVVPAAVSSTPRTERIALPRRASVFARVLLPRRGCLRR